MRTRSRRPAGATAPIVEVFDRKGGYAAPQGRERPLEDGRTLGGTALAGEAPQMRRDKEGQER